MTRTITLSDGRVAEVRLVETRTWFVAACSRFGASPARAYGLTEAAAIAALRKKLENGNG